MIIKDIKSDSKILALGNDKNVIKYMNRKIIYRIELLKDIVHNIINIELKVTKKMI